MRLNVNKCVFLFKKTPILAKPFIEFIFFKLCFFVFSVQKYGPINIAPHMYRGTK